MTPTPTKIRKARLRALLGVYGLIEIHFNRQKVKGQRWRELQMNCRCLPPLRDPVVRGWVKIIAKGLFNLGKERGTWGEKVRETREGDNGPES